MLLELDEQHRSVLTEMQQAQARRNEASKQIGKAKASGDEAAANALIAEVGDLKTRTQELEEQERALSEQLEERPARHSKYAGGGRARRRRRERQC